MPITRPAAIRVIGAIAGGDFKQAGAGENARPADTSGAAKGVGKPTEGER